MGQAHARHARTDILSVAECVGLAGEAREALCHFDFVVRSAAVSAKTGRTTEEAQVIGRALTTVLMTIATDMAFVAAEDADKDILHASLRAALDDCFSWSDGKRCV